MTSKRPQWPVLPSWSAELSRRLDNEWGLAARISRELGIDASVLTSLKKGEYRVSEWVMEISDLAGIARPFQNVSVPAIREILRDLEELDAEDLETIRALATRLKKSE